jgi:hypothetical protein
MLDAELPVPPLGYVGQRLPLKKRVEHKEVGTFKLDA